MCAYEDRARCCCTLTGVISPRADLSPSAGFPFPIGPNFVRQTIRYEVRARSSTCLIMGIHDISRRCIELIWEHHRQTVMPAVAARWLVRYWAKLCRMHSPSYSACAPLQVERDRLWTFEQPQNLAFTNVHTTIRMTVVRLSSGGLFVYSPIAPTACVSDMHAIQWTLARSAAGGQSPKRCVQTR